MEQVVHAPAPAEINAAFVEEILISEDGPTRFRLPSATNLHDAGRIQLRGRMQTAMDADRQTPAW
jgi:hypothetical protein